MDDAGAVSRGERVRNLNPDPQCVIERQRTFLEPLFECLAFQILHHQKINSVFSTDVVQRTDVRMIQIGDGSRLALKSPSQIRSLGQMPRQDLKRYGSI